MDYFANDLASFRYISHYGVLGQKWGIRRYQNKDGTLTKEGRRRAIKEYREDNQKAHKYGAEASIYNQAYKYAQKNQNAANEKLNRKWTQKRENKKKAADAVAAELKAKKQQSAKQAEQHYKELVRKYGKEAVSDIKRDKNGSVNENVSRGRDWLISSGLTAASFATSAAVGLPLFFTFVPETKYSGGSTVYNNAMKKEWAKYK